MQKKEIKPNTELVFIPMEKVVSKILLIRGKKVMIDKDLALLYGVETKRINEAVKRNPARFPTDFMFQLNKKEAVHLVSQNVIPNSRSQIATTLDKNLKSQIATSRWGGTRKLPIVFTEQGVAMLSSVLNSNRAIQVNIEIMRTFIKLRNILAEHKDLLKKIEAMEKNYDRQFRIVFQIIRELTNPPEKPQKQIGFRT